MTQSDAAEYNGEETLELMTIATDTSEEPADAPVAVAAEASPAGLWLGGRLCRETEAPTEANFAAALSADSYLSGIPAEPRPLLPGYDTGVGAMVIGVFLLVALNLRHYTTFLKGFAQDLWSVKLRDNLFEDRTVSETKVTISLIMLLCLSEGILLNYIAPVHRFGAVSPFHSVAILTGCAVLFYILQFCACYVVGHVFTANVSALIWLRGFNASQVLLGLCLWVPALIVLFNPSLGHSMLIFGAVLYVLARIIFVSKGFRIFYNNIFSLIYFILYLCALEIIPLLVAARAADFLTQS